MHVVTNTSITLFYCGRMKEGSQRLKLDIVDLYRHTYRPIYQNHAISVLVKMDMWCNIYSFVFHVMF